MFRLSTNKLMNYSNQLNKILMFYSSINQKGKDYKTFPKWHTLIWNAKTLLKTSNNIPTSPIYFSKPLEYDFVINKINFIILINVASFMKKI